MFPCAGEKPETSVVIAPCLPRLLVLEGDPAGHPAVALSSPRRFPRADLRPRQLDASLAGQSFPQAEVNLGGAVSAMAARNITFDRCAVRHVGRYAMAFGAGCRDNLVDRCELVDLGGGGVQIGQAAPPGKQSWNMPAHRSGRSRFAPYGPAAA